MEIDKKAEVLFLLIVFLMLPTFYVVHYAMQEAKYKISCTPVLYVDAGIPGEDVESLEKNDTALCAKRCTTACIAQIGAPCKGVHHAIYSEIYGVSCVCELYPVDKDYADDCIDLKKEKVNNEE